MLGGVYEILNAPLSSGTGSKVLRSSMEDRVFKGLSVVSVMGELGEGSEPLLLLSITLVLLLLEEEEGHTCTDEDKLLTIASIQ